MKQRFNSLTPELIAKRKLVHELCRQFSRSPSKGNLKRVRALLGYCGDDVIIESGIHMDYGDHISLGHRVYININCTLLDGVTNSKSGVESNAQLHSVNSDNTMGISIGDDCLIGPNVQLLAVSHDVDPTLRESHKYNYVQGISLGKNVWLGAGVIVLPGVTIGDNCVIGAGSVVTKDATANCFYAGNPAVKIREL